MLVICLSKLSCVFTINKIICIGVIGLEGLGTGAKTTFCGTAHPSSERTMRRRWSITSSQGQIKDEAYCPGVWCIKMKAKYSTSREHKYRIQKSQKK